MFSTLRNELQVTFTITTASPLSIRASKPSGIDPVLPDMQVVRDAAGRPFIPGSTLKGVIRSRVEQVLRSLRPFFACDPLKAPCTSVKQRELSHASSGEARYRLHCYACRLFGSTALGSRISFADAPPLEGHEPVTSERHNVAIDRRTGGQYHGALFTPEVVEEGRFEAKVRLTNFALWQVLALLQTLQDLHEGFITLGGGSSRGFGRVKIELDKAWFAWRDLRRQPPERLQGYRGGDVAPGPVPGRWQRDLAGWRIEWQGADALMGPEGALARLDLEQALRQDFELAGTGGGGRR